MQVRQRFFIKINREKKLCRGSLVFSFQDVEVKQEQEKLARGGSGPDPSSSVSLGDYERLVAPPDAQHRPTDHCLVRNVSATVTRLVSQRMRSPGKFAVTQT